MIFKKKGYGSQLNVYKCSWWKRENGDINQVPYNMSNQQLPTTDQQWDLGIIIVKHLKWQKQIDKSCKTANRVLGFIAHNFRYKKKN